MYSPFPYERFASSSSFYGREAEIKYLRKFADESNNLVLFSKRRLGKSSLVQEAFRESEYLFIYCDIFDITSKEEFANKLLKAASNAIKGNIQEIALQLRSIFKRVIPDFSIDSSGVPHIKPSTRSLDFEEMMDDFFTLLFQLSQKQKVVLAIDEFQQIASLGDARVDATLRKYMQQNKNISYFFLGSKRHLLNTLFEYHSPLYEMATPMELHSMLLDDVYRYTAEHLHIAKDVVSYAYELCDGETKLLQHIFHILYMSKRENEIKTPDIDKALEEILLAKSSSYRVIFESFSQYQKKVFKLLSQNDKNYFYKEVLEAYKISKGTALSSLKQLYKREIVDKENEKWFIPDRAFELWGKSLE